MALKTVPAVIGLFLFGNTNCTRCHMTLKPVVIQQQLRQVVGKEIVSQM